MRILRRVLLALSVLLVLAAAGVTVRFYGFAPLRRPPPSLTAPRTEAAVARGRYLAEAVLMCRECHSPIDESKPGEPTPLGPPFSGRDFARSGFPLPLRAPNLTPDPETGIGRASDGELVRAMREGIGRDGRALFPLMPYPTLHDLLTDEDALAVVAYLRSLPPTRNDPGKTALPFPLSMLVRAAPRPVETAPPPPPSPSDELAWGRWLLRAANCHSCHDTHDARHEPLPGLALAGGDRFPRPGRADLYAPNISADPATGLGAWSDADIERVLTDGKGRDGRTLEVMPWTTYRNLTPADRHALVVALRKEPAVFKARGL